MRTHRRHEVEKHFVVLERGFTDSCARHGFGGTFVAVEFRGLNGQVVALHTEFLDRLV